jgi:hypothetical protein
MFSIAIVTSAIARAIVTSAKTSHVSSAEATHVTSTETTHVTSAETTHVTSSAKAASAKAAAPVSTAATTTAAACLCSTRRKQRPGNQDRCQYHHRSSRSHECSFRGAELSVIIELLAPAWYGRPAPTG